MRLLRLLIAGAVAGGAAVLLKRLLAEQQQTEPATPPSSPAPSPPSSAGGSGRERSAPVRSTNGGEPTKAELYERAQELGIEGRSRMSKQELRRAIESAG